MLTQQQKQFFAENGYLVLEDLLSQAELEQSRREIQRLHNVAADLEKQDQARFLRHFQREPYVAGKNSGNDLPLLRKIEGTHEFSPLFERMASDPRLVPVLQELLGPELLLFRSTLMLKPAFHGSVHGLHQDSPYWSMYPPTQMTVSIALTDATLENGCIQVIPKSHHWGMLQWGDIMQKQDQSLSDVKGVDTSGLIPVPLRAGNALLFHSLLVHGSGANKSPNPRNTALYAYFPPNVTYTPKNGEPAERTFRVIAGLGGKKTLTFVKQPETAL